MKKSLLLGTLVLALTVSGHTQLLKKLKEKSTQVLAPKSTNQPAATTSEPTPAASQSAAKWTPDPSDVKTFSLAPDETFLYDETRVSAANGKLGYAFILRNGKYQYFLVEDGNRSGPFTQPPIQQLKRTAPLQRPGSDEEEQTSQDDKFNMGSDMNDAVSQKFARTNNSKLFIAFGGKNHGPFDYVNKMLVSADGKKFWALVTAGGEGMMTSMGMGNHFLVNEAGLRKAVDDGTGIPTAMLVSPGFTAAAVTTMSSSMQQATTVSSSGTKLQTTIGAAFAGKKELMAVSDKGDIISIPLQSPTQLLVNGNEVAVFGTPLKSLARLFLHSDYKKSAYYAGGRLYRGDGSVEELRGVLFPQVVTVGNETALYYFRIHQPDANTKDVYLCKKSL